MTGPIPRPLSASRYVLALHRPEDRVAVLVLNRARRQTMQRILRAEDVAAEAFQEWLREQNKSGADIFIGMNPLRNHSFGRTKESIGEIRHVYLDLDEDAVASLRAIRTSGEAPLPNFVLDTSPERGQVVWRVDGLDREQAEALLHSLAAQFRGDRAATDISRVLRMPGFQNNKYHQRATRPITFGTLPSLKAHPTRRAKFRAVTKRPVLRRSDTKVSPNPIGRSRSVPSREAIRLKM
jgi:RepB DNA-primase from phage plasmid